MRTKPKKDCAAQVWEAKVFITKNYFRQIGIPDIAKHVGVDMVLLSRKFKESEGMSIYRYLINTRLEIAMELIKLSGKNMKEIAHHVGYKKQGNFSEAFKDKYGIQPIVVRRTNKN